MIDLDTLTGLVTAEALAEARDAMDLLSITGFHFDKRGRLEAGVKPSPPSTQPPAYARITCRGKKYRPECRLHGKGQWCIHSLILALHHLGCKPEYRVSHVLKNEPAEPKTGYALCVHFDKHGADFKLFSGHRPLVNPLRHVSREAVAIGLLPNVVEMIEDLAEEHASHFHISRTDLAPLLSLLEGVPLHLSPQKTWTRQTRSGHFPKVTLRIEGDNLIREFAEPVAPSILFFQGWPGYLVLDGAIIRHTGYVPDFGGIVKAASQPLSAENLEPLLREKHGIHWSGQKPELIQGLDQAGLSLRVEGRGLAGAVGFWHGDLFLGLVDMEKSRQLIRNKGKIYLLVTDSWSLTRLASDTHALKLPRTGDSGAFRIREQGAAGFLERLHPPATWRVERHKADAWFGLEHREATCRWNTGELSAEYQIGDEWFSHGELLGGLLDNGRGARLGNGRLLNFDTGIVLKNEAVLRGVTSIHEDQDRSRQLLARVLDLEEKKASVPAIALTEAWTKILRPYQAEGVRWLLANHSRHEPSLLADDMGLGKTVQTLAYLDCIREKRPQLIVVPRSLLENWREECRRFCPRREPILHHGPRRDKDSAQLGKRDLVITTYGTLRQDVDLFYDVSFQVAVLDEAQAIKNATSQVSGAVAELWCDHRLCLTGTPVENRLTELWSIFRFLAPGYLGEEEEVKAITIPGTPGFEALKLKVAPFLLRRLKSQVEPDLPEKQEITVQLPMEEGQAALYEHVQRETRGLLGDQEKTNPISILTVLLRLRQVCCHPGLVDEGRVRGESNKFKFLFESLAEVVNSGHSVLIFSQFTKLLGLLRFALEEADYNYLYLDGKTRKRADLVRRFQAGEAPIFLISLKAGGTGLNLTRASYVYHLDPWWNPMVEAQATDRAHRIGQKRGVISYKLISQGTIEEKILKLQAGKRFLAEGLWEDAEVLAKQLDRDTLLGLLG